MTEATDQLSQSDPEQLILGTWDWKFTDLIGRGARPPNDRLTPESERRTEQLRFFENGRVEFYRDGQITETDFYTIEITYEPNSPPEIGRRLCICMARSKPEFRLIGDTLEMWPMGGGSCGLCVVYARAEPTVASDA